MFQQRLYHLYLLACFCIASQTTLAQNLHFSQYFNAPLLVNPANTGFNPDFDFRVGGSQRKQWANVISNPYKTSSIWADAQLLTNQLENGWIGIGATLFNDAAGSAGLQSNKAYLSLAYHQMVGIHSLVSVGFSGGYVTKSVDATKLIFDNQWNGKFFDIAQNPNEPFAATRVNYADIGLGVNYAWFDDDVYFNTGLSYLHINKPNESFYAPNPTINQQVPGRITFFANSQIKLNDLWIINPNLYYSRSAGSGEMVIGMNANRNIDGYGYHQLILGLYLRAKDALIPMLGYQLHNYKCTINYDVTTSALGGAAKNRWGAYELSIVKSGVFGAEKNIKCPSVKF